MTNVSEQARRLVSQMPLEEKASLLGGKDFWHTKESLRAGLPSIMLTDGPHGLRKQASGADHLGINDSVPATCFPTASASACAFDPTLLYRIGKAIGEECREEDVAVLLGPGLNIKRSPLCGRNFEYFSEDPVLSGELAAAFVLGLQSEGVGASVKHFALNNQEARRMIVDSVADERTMREIYLAGFERAIKKGEPWTVMCSYNRVKGVYASENKWLLSDVLRGEWGYNGLVVTDWGAANDRVSGVQAGCDLEMPGSGAYHDKQLVSAVRSGELDEAALDRSAERVVELILKSQAREKTTYDRDAHHALAREAAACAAVLLKNVGSILPLKAGLSLAVIGAFAKTPRYQGAGSSKIVPYRLDCALCELEKLGFPADYAEGYDLLSDEADEARIGEACACAAGKDAVLVFAGLPDRYESEGFDRKRLGMPSGQIALIERVRAVNENVIVVLAGGSVIDMAWEQSAKAIVMAYLGGQAGAGGVADVLTGRHNPSGKLAETWPLSLEDNPTFRYFPGYARTVEYREGLFVGYRYYDTAQKSVRYPFGYGLSYTRFTLSSLKTVSENGVWRVSCTLENTGEPAGATVVQLYVSHKSGVLIQVDQELKGFQKVTLAPHEQAVVSFSLTNRDLSYYNVETGDWCVEGGLYELRVGFSSRELPLKTTIFADPTPKAAAPDLRESAPSYYALQNGLDVPDAQFAALLNRPLPPRERAEGEAFTRNSTLAELRGHPLGRILNRIVQKEVAKMSATNDDIGTMIDAMLTESPLRLLAMSGGGFGLAQVDGLVEILNGRLFKGLKLLMQ